MLKPQNDTTMQTMMTRSKRMVCHSREIFDVDDAAQQRQSAVLQSSEDDVENGPFWMTWKTRNNSDYTIMIVIKIDRFHPSTVSFSHSHRQMVSCIGEHCGTKTTIGTKIQGILCCPCSFFFHYPHRLYRNILITSIMVQWFILHQTQRMGETFSEWMVLFLYYACMLVCILGNIWLEMKNVKMFMMQIR